MARCGAVAMVSTITWRWWETWALEGAHRAGLDYSPLVGRQESFGRQPALPPTLPNLLVVRNPLPSWIAPLVVPNSDSNSSSGSSTATRLPECSRASPDWPLLNLRQHFRRLINASEEGEDEQAAALAVVPHPWACRCSAALLMNGVRYHPASPLLPAHACPLGLC
mgnify:CR=1 FL=1